MKVKTSIKAGFYNHNEALVRAASQAKGAKAQARGLKVKTGIKAGAALNHNEVLVPDGMRKTRAK
jgi:hypothetical protein